jgi:hypothetical protein
LEEHQQKQHTWSSPVSIGKSEKEKKNPYKPQEGIKAPLRPGLKLRRGCKGYKTGRKLAT